MIPSEAESCAAPPPSDAESCSASPSVFRDNALRNDDKIMVSAFCGPEVELTAC